MNFFLNVEVAAEDGVDLVHGDGYLVRQEVVDLADLTGGGYVVRSVWYEDFIALPEGIVIRDVVVGASDFRNADRGVDDFVRFGAVHVEAR